MSLLELFQDILHEILRRVPVRDRFRKFTLVSRAANTVAFLAPVPFLELCQICPKLFRYEEILRQSINNPSQDNFLPAQAAAHREKVLEEILEKIPKKFPFSSVQSLKLRELVFQQFFFSTLELNVFFRYFPNIKCVENFGLESVVILPRSNPRAGVQMNPIPASSLLEIQTNLKKCTSLNFFYVQSERFDDFLSNEIAEVRPVFPDFGVSDETISAVLRQITSRTSIQMLEIGIPIREWSSLRNLKELMYQIREDNDFLSFANSIGSMPSLRVLDLDGGFNKVQRSDPLDFLENLFPNLEKLRMTFSGLKWISSKPLNLPRLKSLSLQDYHDCPSLAPFSLLLPQLEDLSFCSNFKGKALEEDPLNIIGCKDLRSLELRCPFSPTIIFLEKFPKLEVLNLNFGREWDSPDLNGFKFADFLSKIVDSNVLRELSVSGVPVDLHTLQNGISKLKKLEVLQIGSLSPRTLVDDSWYPELSKLDRLCYFSIDFTGSSGIPQEEIRCNRVSFLGTRDFIESRPSTFRYLFHNDDYTEKLREIKFAQEY